MNYKNIESIALCKESIREIVLRDLILAQQNLNRYNIYCIASEKHRLVMVTFLSSMNKSFLEALCLEVSTSSRRESLQNASLASFGAVLFRDKGVHVGVWLSLSSTQQFTGKGLVKLCSAEWALRAQ